MTGENSTFLIPAADGLDAAAADILGRMLDSGAVAAVLGPFSSDDGRPEHRLASKSGVLSELALFSPVFAGNIASAASRLSRMGPLPQKVALPVKPCEAAALVELAKIQQIDMDSFIIILADCAGTADAEQGKSISEVSAALASGSTLEDPRPVCGVCTRTGPEKDADIIFGAWGLDKKLMVAAVSEMGQQALRSSYGDELDGGVIPEDAYMARKTAVEKVMSARSENRSAMLEQLSGTHTGIKGLKETLKECIVCRNCSEVCPICYCKDCKFKLEPMETEGAIPLLSAVNRGCIRFPVDPLYFHLGRMVHMAESCINCGACSDACPNGIDVASLFLLASESVQAAFSYRAGRDTEDARPLTCYVEDELEELGR